MQCWIRKPNESMKQTRRVWKWCWNFDSCDIYESLTSKTKPFGRESSWSSKNQPPNWLILPDSKYPFTRMNGWQISLEGHEVVTSQEQSHYDIHDFLVSWSFTIKCLNIIYHICLEYFSTHSTLHNSHYVSNMEIWLKFLNLICFSPNTPKADSIHRSTFETSREVCVFHLYKVGAYQI